MASPFFGDSFRFEPQYRWRLHLFSAGAVHYFMIPGVLRDLGGRCAFSYWDRILCDCLMDICALRPELEGQKKLSKFVASNPENSHRNA